MRAFLQSISVHADYAWFVAATLWTMSGWLWWRGRNHNEPAANWAPWAAAAGLTTALLEITFNSLGFVEYFEPRVARSYLLGVAGGGVALGFALSVTAISGRWLAPATILVFGLSAFLRHDYPAAASLIECAVSLGLAVLWYRQTPARATGGPGAVPRSPALPAALLGWVGTAGPLALWTQEEARWVDSSLWAWPAALVHIAVAAALTRGLLQVVVKNNALVRLIRITTLALGLWLAVGFGLAWAASRQAKQFFQTSAEARARTAALLLNGDELARIVGPGLRFTEKIQYRTPEGWTSDIWLSPRLQDKDTVPARDLLQRILQANPDVRFVDFSIAREGALLAVLFPTGSPGKGHESAWQRLLTFRHAHSWNTGEPLFEGPFRNPWGTMVHALAPVRTARNRTVGWVVLQWSSGQWAASQLHARLLAFAVLGAGVIVGLLWLGRRIGAMDRTAALQSAAVALAEKEAQTAFLAKVSHELRTPLQGILGYARILGETAEDQATARRLGLLTGEAEHLQRLVEDLLDLSALNAGGFRLVDQACDLRRLIADTVESFEPNVVRKGLSLRQVFEGDGSGWVRTDVMRLRQILINLLSNALKFTREGGIVVKLHLQHEAESVRVALRVIDTGPGIPADEIPRLFRPFARLPGAHGVEGTGLGLALSASLCQRLGGALTAESDGRTGSVFCVDLVLPVASSRAEVPAPPASPAAPPSLGGRVLVVDDHPAVRELYQDWLTNAGVLCQAAATAEEARAHTAQQAFDAIILDLSLGPADGALLAREWKMAASPKDRPIRIVGVSAHAAAHDRERALQSGMDAFLLKPVTRRDLLSALQLQPRGDEPRGLPEALQRRFSIQMDADWRRLRLDLAAAIEVEDWSRVASDAHYLKNSADILSLGRLQAACVRLETAAGSGDRASIRAAFAELTDNFATSIADAAQSKN